MNDETILEYPEPLKITPGAATAIGFTPFDFTPLPIGDINIIEGSYADGIKHIYKPQEDITTYELALLLNLFVFASAYTGIHSYNYWGYVKEKGLERHFT